METPSEAVPFQARHVGASVDAALGNRTRLPDKSVARYEPKTRTAANLGDLDGSQIPVHIFSGTARLDCTRSGETYASRSSEPVNEEPYS